MSVLLTRWPIYPRLFLLSAKTCQPRRIPGETSVESLQIGSTRSGWCMKKYRIFFVQWEKLESSFVEFFGLRDSIFLFFSKVFVYFRSRRCAPHISPCLNLLHWEKEDMVRSTYLIHRAHNPLLSVGFGDTGFPSSPQMHRIRLKSNVFTWLMGFRLWLRDCATWISLLFKYRCMLDTYS